MVGSAGLEPATPCVSCKCSTPELTAHRTWFSGFGQLTRRDTVPFRGRGTEKGRGLPGVVRNTGAMPPSMEVSIDESMEYPIVRVSGELDLATLDRFEATVQTAASLERGAVIVSLLETTYCDSLTVSSILSLQGTLDADDQDLLLVMSDRGTPRRVFDIVGVTKRLCTYGTIAEATLAASELVTYRKKSNA